MKDFERRARAGLTLIEILIGTLILSILLVKVSLAVRATLQFSGQENTRLVLQGHAERVLDQIAYALLGAESGTVGPVADAPFGTTGVTYRVSLGIEDGEVVWSDPETIGLDDDADNKLLWKRDDGGENEMRVVWTSLVRPFLEGELLNGIDDNGNGVVDEKGLSFEMDGKGVLVRLTLGEIEGETVVAERTLETMVTCRNFVE